MDEHRSAIGHRAAVDGPNVVGPVARWVLLWLGFGMGSRLARAPRRAFLVPLGFCLLFCCCSCSSTPDPSRSEMAMQASAQLEVSDNFSAAELQNQFQEIATRVAPSVVAISATEIPLGNDAADRSDDTNGERLSTLLSSVDRTVGTGFVIDADGYVLTNDHVVAHAEQLWITLDDHRVFPAMVVGSDPRGDLAVLKIPATGLTPVRFADGNKVKRGQWTIALGNPYGLSGSGDMCASVGIVSAVERSLPRLADREDRLYSGLIQTTAQINPGNSGGPLFDLEGRVIGVNTAVILPQKQANGIGFAIPATSRLIEQVHCLKQGREVVYGYLGVHVTTPTAHESQEARCSGAGGARIDSVDERSPAAGQLRVGDIVTRLNDEAVVGGDQFVRLVGQSPVDQDLPAVVHRGDKTLTVSIRLRRRQTAETAVTRERQRLRWRGLILGPIPADWNAPGRKRPDGGVLVLGIDPGSPFQKEGIIKGTVITGFAGKSVSDLNELQMLINQTPAQKCALRLLSSETEVVAAE